VIAQREGMADLTLGDLLRLQVQLQMRFLGVEAPKRTAEILHGCYNETKAIIERNTKILARLSAEYRLGVASNFSGNLATVCREFGMDHFFEVILDSKIIGMSKPDYRLFKPALEKLQQNPHACYFVGDSFARDIQPAKFLGVRTVWLRSSEAGLCSDPEKADFIITALTELPSILKNAHVSSCNSRRG
jgi:putative hydrolase of the HAD superfamily